MIKVVQTIIERLQGVVIEAIEYKKIISKNLAFKLLHLILNLTLKMIVFWKKLLTRSSTSESRVKVSPSQGNLEDPI
jgi:hypothetical protein